MITLANISKTYGVSGHRGRIDVLANLSFSIPRGELTVVVGPSGCGKTTLLNIISGLDKSFGGQVAFCDRQYKIGYMFQTPSLIPWRTIWENIALGCEIEGVPRGEFEPRAVELLDRYGLQEFAKAYPHSLSQGMQQRVAFIRLILFGANLLLLDEPFSRLDYIARRELYRDLQSLFSDADITVLAVTHDIEEAVILADKVVVLSPRPAELVSEVAIPLDRSQRINSAPGVLGEMTPYLARLWQDLKRSQRSTDTIDLHSLQ